MGLWTNLRVLCGSDIGDRVRDLTRTVKQLQGELDSMADLCESRHRRYNKREKDDQRRPAVPMEQTSPAVDRLLARRAARGSGPVLGQNGR